MTANDSNSAKQQQQQPQQKPPPQQQPRRAPLAARGNANSQQPSSTAAAVPELASLLDALEKFEKSARRVATRMGSNLVSLFGGKE